MKEVYVDVVKSIDKSVDDVIKALLFFHESLGFFFPDRPKARELEFDYFLGVNGGTSYQKFEIFLCLQSYHSHLTFSVRV